MSLNKIRLGCSKIQNIVEGLVSEIFKDFKDEEIIELKVDDDFVDISESKKLPDEVRLSTKPKMDENIEALVKASQLKDVVKSEIGSPDAEIVYNTEIKKGDYLEWR